MRGGEFAVECWDCQQMANVRGEGAMGSDPIEAP